MQSDVSIDCFADSQNVEHWSHPDVLNQVRQLGVLPTPEQPGD
jgi:hypothetical protein